MVNFRRVIMAIAVLALFTGMALADVGTGQAQLTCATNVTVTPALRGEGYTEQTGDITITCTGGSTPTLSTIPVSGPPTSVVPLVNFTIFYNTLVTSRLFSTTTNASEALLLIDEPGATGLAGDGPQQIQKLCTTPLTGCVAYVSATAPVPPGGTLPTPYAIADRDGTRAPNVYQGIVNGNSVTFFGVPVLAPTTAGSRVFRITNVRVNAVPLSGGSASGGTPVQAYVSTSPASALSISNSTPNVGFVSASLTATADSIGTLNQCTSVTRTAISTLSFKEGFGTAFKTRLNPTSNTAYNAQTGLVSNGTYPGTAVNATSQSTPNAIVNSESNFVYPVSASDFAGLAGYGTRLKATFNNIPNGARLFVSNTNVNNALVSLGAPLVVGGTNPGLNSWAQLVSSDTALDSVGATAAPTSLVDPTVTTTNGTVTNISEITLANGTGTATWEVLNTNPNANETFKFGVYITYVSNVAQNFPPAGISTVNLSYAPTATSAAATNSAILPRFTGDSSAARTILTIAICRTVLLYPFVTNQAGFDTGISVANTTVDPFGTGAQAGKCMLNWYGGTTATPTVSPAAYDTGTIAAGAVYANTVQTMAPTFQGYMIAVCNFQYAHGFAAVSSNYGAANGIFTTYLAVVLTDGRANTNTVTAENGGN